jgi:hypothetical protein
MSRWRVCTPAYKEHTAKADTAALKNEMNHQDIGDSGNMYVTVQTAIYAPVILSMSLKQSYLSLRKIL